MDAIFLIEYIIFLGGAAADRQELFLSLALVGTQKILTRLSQNGKISRCGCGGRCCGNGSILKMHRSVHQNTTHEPAHFLHGGHFRPFVEVGIVAFLRGQNGFTGSKSTSDIDFTLKHKIKFKILNSVSFFKNILDRLLRRIRIELRSWK